MAASERPRRLRAHFAWTFGGYGIYAISRWLAFAVLAKLLSPDEVGRYALAVALVAPIFAFAGMNLRSIRSTDAHALTLFRDYAAARIITTLAALLITVGIALVGNYDDRSRALIMLVGCIQAGDWLSDLCFGLFDQQERFDLSARSLMLRGPLRLAGLAAAVWYTGHLEAGLAAELVINAAVLLGHDIVAAAGSLRDRPQDGLWPRWNLAAQRGLLSLSLPMSLLLLAASIQTNLPRYFVDAYRGSHELGIFAALSVLALAGTPVVAALGQAALPRLARHLLAREHGAFQSILRKLVGVAAVLGIGGIVFALLFGKLTLRLLYTEEYAASATMLVWLMAASTATYVATMYAIAVTATREYRPPLITQIISFAVAVPAYFALTAKWGAVGSSIGSLVHSVLTTFGFAYIVRKRNR